MYLCIGYFDILWPHYRSKMFIVRHDEHNYGTKMIWILPAEVTKMVSFAWIRLCAV